MKERREVHLRRVAPGLNPDGLWVRLCTADELLSELPVSNADAEGMGVIQGEIAGAAADRGEPSWCYVYDGDSGECMATFFTEP